jgi:hypothetical protein
METNDNEPLMKCRKFKVLLELGTISIPGQVRGGQVYCPCGGRHKGGVNIILAFVGNMGICRSDTKGEIQVEDP